MLLDTLSAAANSLVGPELRVRASILRAELVYCFEKHDFNDLEARQDVLGEVGLLLLDHSRVEVQVPEGSRVSRELRLPVGDHLHQIGLPLDDRINPVVMSCLSIRPSTLRICFRGRRPHSQQSYRLLTLERFLRPLGVLHQVRPMALNVDARAHQLL